MARSITGTITLAATVAFAAPIVLAGINFFLGGDRLLGAGVVAVGVLMVVFEEYLMTPGDIPAEAAGKVVGGIVIDEDEEE